MDQSPTTPPDRPDRADAAAGAPAAGVSAAGATGPDVSDADAAGADAWGVVDAAPADPVATAVAALRSVDQLMAQALRAVAAAGPVDGMPADRVIALSASSTGWDVRYLQGVADTLAAMPLTWAAFDDGRIGWAQLRGIVKAARMLRVADRAALDAALVAAVEENGSGEPERLVEVAEDLAARLDEPRTVARERSARSRSWLAFQQLLDDPGADVHGYLGDPAAVAAIFAGLDAAADPPAQDAPAVDDDGQPLPKSWRAGTSRAAQHAEALRRVCAAYLTRHGTGAGSDAGTDDTTEAADADVNGGGAASDADPNEADGTGPGGEAARADATDSAGAGDAAGAGTGGAGMPQVPREARHAMYVVCDVSQLPEAAALGLPDAGAVTPRVVWQLAGGRAVTSVARVQQLACDAVRIPVLTDGATVLAIGDAHDPIGPARRRAVVVRDQGCRMPGCRAPAAHADVHHGVHRADGGATELNNLVALCRRCHTDVHAHRWRLRLHPDGRFTVTVGRRTFTSRPPLRPPRGDPPDTGPSTTDDVGGDADRDTTTITNATEPLPF